MERKNSIKRLYRRVQAAVDLMHQTTSEDEIVILSSWLEDSVQTEGIDSTLMNSFFNEREKLFSPDFLKGLGITPEEYEKRYHSSIKILKN